MRFLRYPLLLLVLFALCISASAAQQPLPFVQGSWTFVLLPDTQNYARSHPQTFISQTRWIADQAAERNIAFVAALGDITNDNNAEQWKNAKAAYSLLDGKVPYALQLGNHDFRPNVFQRKSQVNKYFPPELVQKSPTYGGVYERGKLDNAYYLFSAGGRDWVVLSLEFAPRDGVLKWANKVLDVYSDRSAMICTHAYIARDGQRFDHTRKAAPRMSAGVSEGINDAEQMWRKLVSKHANVVFVFCGHVGLEKPGRLASKGVAGNTVHELLSDYQRCPNGGDGYLRLVEFLPDGRTVQVKTYSTTRNDYKTDPTNQFTLEIAPAAKKPEAVAAQ